MQNALRRKNQEARGEHSGKQQQQIRRDLKSESTVHKQEKVFATAVLLWLFTASVFAVDFASPVSYPVGTAPAAVVVADFNGDGKLDLAVANSGSGNVSILLGNGDGTLRAAVNYDAAVATPVVLSKGDFNSDGKLDLAVFSPGDTGTLALGVVSILLGNGDGSFQPPRTTPLTVATDLAVADFNLDGKADLAVTDYDSNSGAIRILVLIGNGDGTFQSASQGAVVQSTLLSGSNFKYFTVADFNSDGKPDLSVQVAGGVRVLLNRGDGTFQAGPIATVADGFLVDYVDQAEDVNGDGRMDLVARTMSFSHSPSTEGWSRRADTVSVFVGNGDGTLQPEKVAAASAWNKSNVFAPALGDSIDSPALGNYNGDGKLDLALWRTTLAGPAHTSRSLEIHLGRKDGTFSAARLTLSYPNTVHTGTTDDLNGDHLDDLILTDLANNAVLVALNTSAASGADLGIIGASASPDHIGVGMSLTYTANLLNEGPNDSTGVTFTDTLPNGVSFVSVTTTAGSCTQSHGVVTCNIGSLASAFDATVTIVVTPTATGRITNTMRVSATEDDLVPANNSATQPTTVVQSFALTVAKTGTGNGTVTSRPSGIDCGGVCSQNYASGTSVSLTATPSADSTFVGWSGACAGTDPNSCSVTVNVAQSVTATFNVTPDFTMAAAEMALTVKRGGRVSEVLTFPSQGGFSGTISLACSVSGPSPMPTCNLSPASVAAGNSVTLTINAAALAGVLAPTALERAGTFYAAWLPLVMLGGIVIASVDKKRRGEWTLGFLVMATMGFAACGGSTTVSPPSQHYSVTVTAISETVIQHSLQISVTVQ
jgi:uncharacterized repeat protein (TIGR01451 family)